MFTTFINPTWLLAPLNVFAPNLHFFCVGTYLFNNICHNYTFYKQMSSTHICVKLCIVTLWTIDCFEANIGSFAECIWEKLGKPCSLSQKLATFAQDSGVAGDSGVAVGS